MLGDPMRTRQILRNYLDNALKFTERAARCGWRRAAWMRRVRLEVHDTGAGIDADTQAAVSGPSTRADASLTKRHGGTGLRAVDLPRAGCADGWRVGVHSQPQQNWQGRTSAAGHGHARAGAGCATRRHRAMVVEDDPVNMMIATTLLEQWGVRTERAPTAGRPCEAVQRQAEPATWSTRS